jgi:RNA polymerase sigma factor (sigma-70 family)
VVYNKCIAYRKGSIKDLKELLKILDPVSNELKRRFCRGLPNRNWFDADCVIAAIEEKKLKSIESYNPNKSRMRNITLRGWFRSIASNAAINALKKRNALSRGGKAVTLSFSELDQDFDLRSSLSFEKFPSHQVSGEMIQLEALLGLALNDLLPRERAALILKIYKDLNDKQIAENLDLESKRQASAILKSARYKLKRGYLARRRAINHF